MFNNPGLNMSPLSMSTTATSTISGGFSGDLNPARTTPHNNSCIQCMHHLLQTHQWLLKQKAVAGCGAPVVSKSKTNKRGRSGNVAKRLALNCRIRG